MSIADSPRHQMFPSWQSRRSSRCADCEVAIMARRALIRIGRRARPDRDPGRPRRLIRNDEAGGRGDSHNTARLDRGELAQLGGPGGAG